MNWKRWPYWLRGGVIGVLILVIILFLSIILALIGKVDVILNNPFIYIIVKILASPTSILNLFPIDPINNSILWYCFGIISGVIVYFLIGAVIGWIVGKIKSKK